MGELMDASTPRRIMHVDMDAYFASLEQGINPRLHQRPVIVGSSPDARGVVSTASYEARSFGVRSGMSSAQAGKLCPHGAFVGVDVGHYTFVSSQLLSIFSEFSPCVEAVSVDEAFLDISGCSHLFGGEESLASQLKRRIKEVTSLTCSVGVAPNKTMAKLASSVYKPDGLTILNDGDIPLFLYPLPVEKLWGVGLKTLDVLHRMGINTVGDLAIADLSSLRRRFGKCGMMLGRIARGDDHADVLPPDEQPPEKSIGHERTFLHDTEDRVYLTATLNYLADLVARRMRCHHVTGRTVTLKCRYADFQTITRRTTMDMATDESRQIYRQAVGLFDSVFTSGRKMRLLGVSLSHLSGQGTFPQQTDMLAISPHQRSHGAFDRVVDQIRDKFGEKAILNAHSTLRTL